jgi:hypothetical protein
MAPSWMQTATLTRQLSLPVGGVCQCLDLGLPSLQNRDKYMSVLYKLLSLGHFLQQHKTDQESEPTYFILVLTCIFLITNDIKYLFIDFIPTHIFSLEKCPNFLPTFKLCACFHIVGFQDFLMFSGFVKYMLCKYFLPV